MHTVTKMKQFSSIREIEKKQTEASVEEQQQQQKYRIKTLFTLLYFKGDQKK